MAPAALRLGLFFCGVETASICCRHERSTAQCLAVRCRYAISGAKSRTFSSFGAENSRRQEIAMSATSNPKAVGDIEALFSGSLAEVDPDIADVVAKELGRQRDEIELIASENIVSRAVLEAQGSVLTNKYAEGLPGKRY